jgi:hypothetical protein
MKRDRNKFGAVRRVTEYVRRRSNKGVSTKVTTKNSITSATIQPEVWIASGLVLSVVQQIVVVSLLIKDTNEQE